MKRLGLGTKKLICAQTFACYTTVNMQILSSKKLVSMLGIKPMVVEEHLSHTKIKIISNHF
jgi:hypothetical protein